MADFKIDFKIELLSVSVFSAYSAEWATLINMSNRHDLDSTTPEFETYSREILTELKLKN